MSKIISNFKPAILLTLYSTILLCVIYPLVVTLFAEVFFSDKANGSLIKSDKGEIIGSELIGQNFTSDKYFWGRLSGTSPAYNASASSGTNLGPNNPTMLDNVKVRASGIKPVPVDYVTASGSGLDPHISVAAALYQVDRVVTARELNRTKIQELVERCTERKELTILGEEKVNVLKLNLALDRLKP